VLVFGAVRNVGKICGVCGATIIAVIVNGAPVETCRRNAASTCPLPGIEWVDAHTPDPEGTPIVRQSTELRPVAPPPQVQQLFASAPQSPEFPYASFIQMPSMSPALWDDLARRRLPVIYTPPKDAVRAESIDPVPEPPEQMTVGKPPAAEFHGPTYGLIASVSAAYGALTLTDENGVDVTALHNA
jgi:hypothetical protein